jgi:hypothetical protein
MTAETQVWSNPNLGNQPELMERRTLSMGTSRITIVAVALSLVACGSGAASVASAPPSDITSSGTTRAVARVNDAVLDCVDGEVLRSPEIRVVGATEDDVVTNALASWPGSAPVRVKDGSGKDRWVAVDGDREIASATPEKNGDDTWVVHDVQACGAPKTTPAAIDGALDCVSDRTWQEIIDYAPDAEGKPTARDAVVEALKPFNDHYAGEVVLNGTGTGSLVVGGREQVLVHASAAPAGGFLVSLIEHCDGFER